MRQKYVSALMNFENRTNSFMMFASNHCIFNRCYFPWCRNIQVIGQHTSNHLGCLIRICNIQDIDLDSRYFRWKKCQWKLLKMCFLNLFSDISVSEILRHSLVCCWWYPIIYNEHFLNMFFNHRFCLHHPFRFRAGFGFPTFCSREQ